METAKRLIARYGSDSWSLVETGESGAEVCRSAGLFLKVDEDVTAITAETERLEWLAGQGVATAKVVDHGQDGQAGWLITESVPGIPAADWPGDDLGTVVRSLADIARMLHALPTGSCPFHREVDVTTRLATAQVQAGLVDLDNLEDEYAGWTGDQLLGELERNRPPAEDLVVCHGDLTPENVLLVPGTGELAGFIDVGKLGIADRWLDLAILHRELSDDPFQPGHAEQFLAQYGTPPAPAKLSYYILLDEFF
ncbi:APH(3') family aminoglycoside O-phosphotransferase [Kribbella solani]|uniref:APH(3') family aminoglycoside O-phosphotransferase n=1 Tax=Kribbella solani TaxID=236067 RepID=UPI0029A68400|nr:APH(3') family aminoglycoside O-phosphotransferase [Kribbella solani]MDX2972073.1 aminoglycoside 3'-phosphotransferase [Kribbella solani]